MASLSIKLLPNLLAVDTTKLASPKVGISDFSVSEIARLALQFATQNCRLLLKIDFG